MYKLLPFLVVLAFMGCRGKARHSTNIECSGQPESVVDTFMASENDTSNCLLRLVSSGETYVEECQTVDNDTVKRTGTDIYVYLLSDSFGRKDNFLEVEVVNQKQDTIFYVDNIFLSPQKEGRGWKPVRYPGHYVKSSLGHFIPPQKSITLPLYFPCKENAGSRREYRLQLVFCTAARETHYYLYKNFIVE